MFDLKGKTIVVSGASSGIGKACAIQAAELGARMVLLGRDEARLQETATQLSGEDHYTIAHNITDYQGLKDMLTAILDSASLKVHGFVHAAGIDQIMPFSLTKAQTFRDMYELNVIAGLELIKVLSQKKYSPDTGASYLYISSIMSNVANYGLSSYCASKSAINSLVKSLALEFAERRVRINSVNPGYVDTPMLQKSFNKMAEDEIASIKAAHPLGLGKPEDVSALVCFLLSDDARWITGSNIVIDGGYSSK